MSNTSPRIPLPVYDSTCYSTPLHFHPLKCSLWSIISIPHLKYLTCYLISSTPVHVSCSTQPITPPHLASSSTPCSHISWSTHLAYPSITCSYNYLLHSTHDSTPPGLFHHYLFHSSHHSTSSGLFFHYLFTHSLLHSPHYSTSPGLFPHYLVTHSLLHPSHYSTSPGLLLHYLVCQLPGF